jgi:intracellular multiplication protein IcmV
MPISDIFKVSRKTFFNPAGWIDFENLHRVNKNLLGFFRGLFSVPQAGQKETFEEAIARLNLNEADLHSLLKKFRDFSLIFLFFGLIAFMYAFYLLFSHAFSDFLLGIAVSALFFSQAFRYDFWVFQIKSRKLGASFAEWKNHFLNGKG